MHRRRRGASGRRGRTVVDCRRSGPHLLGICADAQNGPSSSPATSASSMSRCAAGGGMQVCDRDRLAGEMCLADFAISVTAIRATTHGGYARGYDVVLVSDAHTTIDKTPKGAPQPAAVIAHTSLY